MSCSVKISCGKGWGGSQRKIGSLAEEASSPGSSITCTGGLQAVQPSATSTTNNTTTTTTTTTTTVTVASSNPVVVTTSTVTTASTATTVAASVNVIAAGNQKVVPPRPVKSIAAKKGEDITKLFKYIEDNVIGKNSTFFGPFGRRKGKYLDVEFDEFRRPANNKQVSRVGQMLVMDDPLSSDTLILV
ncbi:hypothetical protein ALC56_10777 [Trachymyrmex septentrionalis]|uniref:Uncharacterized protein n=1 Tax=Trachymyrmex septentrionalis TaxID=34720 RepID=A0A195F403_9HYME|nr:hypothetical protein ALC56_10777 [Trachymyrmex septentrionalis]